MSAEKFVVLEGARTPIGTFVQGRPRHELGATAARHALPRTGVAAEDIDEEVLGCIGQVGPDAYSARRVAVAAGLPRVSWRTR